MSLELVRRMGLKDEWLEADKLPARAIFREGQLPRGRRLAM
jgi:hypothetical protein